ncbi:type VI secretion system baseplate subunit TssF [Cellvibrio sp. pealriver]|uniref:type VI secretion system baseplate subunit TssF n=1 Tax=Cellvibrio sp. pealriver TaxID=1622269 RepID=UPI00066FC988|nr:type VI secretion system baseplate subunit TssF [Cellvibrio sp. pealriver]
MIEKMLEYYNSELTYLREAGAEFAEHYPKIAARLTLNGSEVADPYVERLLEGFSFLTARIKLKMDAEFPRFIQRLIEVTYPNYLAPTPSMCIVRFEPGELVRNQRSSYLAPKGSRLRSNQIPGASYCEFRTAHEVELLPLKLNGVGFSPASSELKYFHAREKKAAISCLHLRFTLSIPLELDESNNDSIPIHLCGDLQLASRLYEVIMGHNIGIALRATDIENANWCFEPNGITPIGFTEQEALLPYESQSFQGYRLLHEYFALPGRFHFFSLNHIKRFLANNKKCRTFEVAILLDQATSDLEKKVDENQFSLFCTPAINLISMRADRVPLGDNRNEFHVVPDRERPLDYEVYSVSAADGFDRDHRIQRQFRPFYATHADDRNNHGAYFSIRREPRIASENIVQNGARSTYQGSEVFVSLVDQNDAPYDFQLRQLGIDLLATNRDLPLLIPTGSNQDLRSVSSLPIDGIRIMSGPTRPVAAIDEGQMHWRFISHLHLSYQSLAQPNPEQSAKTLRELLGLYTALGDATLGRYSQALIQCNLNPITRRMPGKGPLVFGRGTAIKIEVDEIPFAGASPYAFGAVLERYLAHHASINSFTEMQLISSQRGLIAQWPARFGERGCL